MKTTLRADQIFLRVTLICAVLCLFAIAVFPDGNDKKAAELTLQVQHLQRENQKLVDQNAALTAACQDAQKEETDVH